MATERQSQNLNAITEHVKDMYGEVVAAEFVRLAEPHKFDGVRGAALYATDVSDILDQLAPLIKKTQGANASPT